MVKRERPVNLDLTTLKFPVTAIVSILHRVSGVVLFLLTPLMLYWLHLSLDTEASFLALSAQLENPFWKLFLWAFSAALAYHLFAGIRHILMDVGFGEALASARKSAVFLVIIAIISVIALGVLVW